MRNIWKIICTDARRICSNVVAIVIIMGLCIVPCLYAWFNIFSNWDPYGTDATSRIRVAVTSEDKGADILGVELNVGDQMISALEANTQIGWVFVDTRQEALSLVYSSDCYAALIVPEDFSKNIVSFINLEFEHPQLQYYENGKKNAIAPKITGQAKNSVQQQVNATFLQTIVSTAAEVVSVLNANGMDAEATLQNLSDTIDKLNGKLDDCNTTLNSLANLTAASQSLMIASGTLVSDMATSIGLTSDLAGNMSDDISATGSNIRGSIAAVVANLQTVGGNLSAVYSDLGSIFADGSVYNQFVEDDIQSRVELVQTMQENAASIAEAAEGLGLSAMAWQANRAAGQLGELAELLGGLVPVDPEDNETWALIQERILAAMDRVSTAREAINAAVSIGSESIGVAIEDTFNNVSDSIGTVQELLSSVQGRTANVANELNGLAGTLGTLESGILTTMSAINKARVELKDLSDFVEALAHSEFLQEILKVLDEGTDVLDSHIASPIKVSEEIMYPANGSYGSQMAPFYTMLAQWVGALFCAVLLKTPLHEMDGLGKIRMPEHYLGRYALFFVVGVTQALITSVGDLLYVGIYCTHPWLFILAAVVSGICFTMINYMLVFTLGAAGLAVSVIVMVLQVAGAGGTYPIEVVPEIFQKLYPYMPFKFGMNAMREAVSGTYGTVYRDNILVLLAISAATIPVGFLIYYPGKWLNDLLEKAKKASEIML